LPFLTAEGSANTGPLEARAGFALTNAMLSALRRCEGALEARIVNETAEAVSARVGDKTLELRPWGVRSLRL
jgi:hypothetical protein